MPSVGVFWGIRPVRQRAIIGCALWDERRSTFRCTAILGNAVVGQFLDNSLSDDLRNAVVGPRAVECFRHPLALASSSRSPNGLLAFLRLHTDVAERSHERLHTVTKIGFAEDGVASGSIDPCGDEGTTNLQYECRPRCRGARGWSSWMSKGICCAANRYRLSRTCQIV